MPTPEQLAIQEMDNITKNLHKKVRSAQSLVIKSIIARLIEQELTPNEAHDKIMRLLGDD